MDPAPLDPAPRGGRETRLLLVTIGVSVGMLLLLARFRFPEESATTAADAAPAPLERLAARATYDELAAIMADLERRIASGVEIVRIQSERTPGGLLPAPRITEDRAVLLVAGDERVVARGTGNAPAVIGRDAAREVAVIAVDRRPGDVVTPRTGAVRPGPRYVAVVEATPQGPAVRPVYVGRTDLFNDPRSNALVLSVSALQQSVSRGAAVFALDGVFIGLASDSAGTVTIIPGDMLKTLAEQAQPAPQTRGDLGVDVQTLSSSLAAAAGADRGVMVTYVDSSGPSAATLLSGDVIQTVDGTGVTTVAGFQQLASSRTPGAAVALGIVRRGRRLQVQVKAADAGRVPVAPNALRDPGIVLRGIDGVGVEIVAIEPGGAGARAGLTPGDIIVALNGRAAPGASEVLRLYRESPAHEALLLTVRRGTAHRVVALEKPSR